MRRRQTNGTMPTLIIGIGNVLLRDEGVGVRAVESMSGIDLPDGVEVLDGGTAGIDLIDVIADRSKVIVIDAVRGTAAPGTIYCFTREALLDTTETTISLHEIGLAEALDMAGRLGCGR